MDWTLASIKTLPSFGKLLFKWKFPVKVRPRFFFLDTGQRRSVYVQNRRDNPIYDVYVVVHSKDLAEYSSLSIEGDESKKDPVYVGRGVQIDVNFSMAIYNVGGISLPIIHIRSIAANESYKLSLTTKANAKIQLEALQCSSEEKPMRLQPNSVAVPFMIPRNSADYLLRKYSEDKSFWGKIKDWLLDRI